MVFAKQHTCFIGLAIMSLLSWGAAQQISTVVVNELFVRDTTESGEDEVYLKITVDGVEQPRVGPHDMNEDSRIERWIINLSYDFTDTFNIEVWEEDSSSGDDLIGSYPVYIHEAEGEQKANMNGDGGDYTLTVYKEATTSTVTESKNCAVAVIDFIESIKASSSTDDEVLSALASFASEYYGAAGKAISGIGTATSQPEVTAIGEAIAALAAPIKQIDDVVIAIGNAGDYADDLYLSLSSDAEDDVAFWPAYDANYNIRTDTSTGMLSGINRMVPYILGVNSTTDMVDVNFWEYDSFSGDDHMGRIRFALNEADGMPRVKLVISEKNGGTIYGVAYRTVPVTCPASFSGAYQSIAQGRDPITKAEQYNTIFHDNFNNRGGIGEQLRAQGIN